MDAFAKAEKATQYTVLNLKEPAALMIQGESMSEYMASCQEINRLQTMYATSCNGIREGGRAADGRVCGDEAQLSDRSARARAGGD